jgi:FAD/FMN-containing dehydrogenase
MATITGFPKLSTTSEVTFNTKGQISRWSDTGVSPDGCAAIVVPSTEEDIVAVVKFSAQSGFKVLPTAGKHGAFLPINERSIYLDLKNFDSIELDEEAGSVEIGGGVVTGRLCSVLAEKGWYTSKWDSF